MSNKSILQSNNDALSANNLDLQSLIDQANALPDAGGVELPELSNEGSAADLLSGKQLIDGEGNVVTGTIATKTSSNLTASGETVTVPAGYYANDTSYTMPNAEFGSPLGSVDENGVVSIIRDVVGSGFVPGGTLLEMTYQLDTQGSATIMPTKESQVVIEKGKYTTGAITVAVIPSQYITTADATASADEIMSGEIAYVNGNKVTGTFSIDSELSAQDDLIAQIQAAVDSLPEASGEGNSFPYNITVNTNTGQTDYYIFYNNDNIALIIVMPSVLGAGNVEVVGGVLVDTACTDDHVFYRIDSITGDVNVNITFDMGVQ